MKGMIKVRRFKILELFGGIGACTAALKRLGVDIEVVDYVEIDKYAVKSYNAINGTNFEPQDITKWDKDIEVDLIMHGSPCQDFSLAGKQAGGDEGSGTRSSLMYETIRIVKKLKPKYVIWENVKNLLSKKHRHNFDAYLDTMEKLGYKNYYQVLNAKDYGIPQNRERVFTISILGDNAYEFPKENIKESEVINPLKGISGKIWQFEQNVYSEDSILRSLKAGGGSGNIPKIIQNFNFPPKQDLKLKLKDILEDEVDEKYYLNNEQIEKIKSSTYHQNNKRIQEKDYSDTLCARDFKGPKCVVADYRYDEGLRIRKNGLSPCLTTKTGSASLSSNTLLIKNKALKETLQTNNIEKDVSYIDSYNRNIRKDDLSGTITTRVSNSNNTFLAIKNNTKKGYLEAEDGDGVYISNIDKKRGTVQKEMIPTLKTSLDIGVCVGSTQKNAAVSKNGICPTLTSAMGQGGGHVPMHSYNLRIRKLTPKECWRLMGFTDDDFEKAAKVNSNSQLYKQAGNSIVVNVLYEILKNLLLNIDCDL